MSSRFAVMKISAHHTTMQEEIKLLEELSPPLDMKRIHAGELSPVFFGSAMNNFGVSACAAGLVAGLTLYGRS